MYCAYYSTYEALKCSTPNLIQKAEGLLLFLVAFFLGSGEGRMTPLTGSGHMESKRESRGCEYWEQNWQ